jgi:hypothetical protein
MWVLLFLLACGGKAQTDSDTTIDWVGGEFEFETTDVRDHCLGGAVEALFMPEGKSTPHEFEHLISLPGFDELPVSYTVDLQPPFVEIPITVDSNDGETLQVRGSVIDAVELGTAAYGDCVVTMTVDLNMTPTSANQAEGDVLLTLTNPRGDDDLCPIFEETPCPIDLQLRATRD